MISEFFIALASGFVDWLAGLFGKWEAPPEFTQVQAAMSDMLAGFVGVGVWVDWLVLSLCVGAALTAWAVVLGIKLIRAVMAHIPVIGGSGD